jgi:phosphoglucosamine mutase
MTEQRKYFGTDGIRGKFGESLINPEFILKLGWAVGKVFASGDENRVLIGKDTRISGYLLESALEAGLSAGGAKVNLLGPIPTPAIAYLTRTFRASAGIVISASHNQYDDNGIKFFGSDGLKLPDAVELEIERYIEQPIESVASRFLGKARRIEDGRGRYIEFCKSTIPAKTNLNGLKIVIDCANGATYSVAPAVFSELGATVDVIHAEPNGLNINAGCGSTYLEDLQKRVVATNADIGIAFDGDGDRVLIVDNQGEVVDGDSILYMLATHETGNHRGVVGTVMSNLGLEHGIQSLGLEFMRTQVGDRYVLEALQNRHWTLGGEPSGHIICLDKTTTGDGIISALQILYLMQKTGKSIAELYQGLQRYPQVLLNVAAQDKAAAMANPQLQTAITDVENSLSDTGRVLIRPSGTEQVIRVMVEGQDDKLIRQYADQIASVIK